jgi:hypothetical protein
VSRDADVHELPCSGCGSKPPAAGCDGLCDDCWIELALLGDYYGSGAVDDDQELAA